MAELIRRVDAGSLSVLDGVIVFWLVLWTAVGAWVGYSLWELADIGGTLVQSGHTLDSAGQTLQRAGQIPLIGQWSEQLSAQVRTTAADIMAQGRETSSYGRQLSVLLAVTVALAPIAPVLGPYLPARLSRRREVADVRRLLRDPDRRRLLDSYLAHRAIGTMPLRRLERLPGDPWSDLTEGRVRALADAELGRLGVRPDRPADVRDRPSAR